MSGDLISRSALSKSICNKECKIPSFESVKELNIFLAGLNVKQIAVMECLGNAPTAYNVDKVVEQLADAILCDGCSGCTNCFELNKRSECGSYKAIEKIVKEGVVE